MAPPAWCYMNANMIFDINTTVAFFPTIYKVDSAQQLHAEQCLHDQLLYTIIATIRRNDSNPFQLVMS